jgi:cell division protein ZapD
VKNKVTYEQPLNERVRNWMRLEHLFACVDNRMSGFSLWDSRAAVNALVDLLDFAHKSDLKPDLIKDLEQHVQKFSRWQQQPNVDTQRLETLLRQLKRLIAELSHYDGVFGKQLGNNYIISSIRQRANVPGGSCHFDLSAYQFWLQSANKQRQADLASWLSHFSLLREAMELNLYLIRNNAINTVENAPTGFFQARLEGVQQYRMVRISLFDDVPYFPEISGGHHRFTLRFVRLDESYNKIIPLDKTVQFELSCCVS